jgi:menaquinol-cytochrome c reductase iron-sulfur subunit
MGDEPDRRGFLKVATCAVGGGLGLVIAAPVLRVVTAPAGSVTVTTPKDPIDVGALERLPIGPSWNKVSVIAPVVSDAWTTAHDVVLGAAWLRRPTGDQTVEALSAVCPHLGCAVGWNAATKTFLCPCHNSAWNESGQLAGEGPAKRALDPLPIKVEDGRLRLTWIAYKLDSANREPA